MEDTYYNGSTGVNLPRDSISTNKSEQLGHVTCVDAVQEQRITWEVFCMCEHMHT